MFRRLFLFPGVPDSGVYRFVVTDQDDETKTTYDYIGPVNDIAVVDSATFQASGDPVVPVLSWAAPAAVNGPVYYRVIVEDGDDSRVWGSDRTPETWVQVPAGRLQPGDSTGGMFAPMRTGTMFTTATRGGPAGLTVFTDLQKLMAS